MEKYKGIVHEPDQMAVPLFWKAFFVRNETKYDSRSDSVAFRFYKHFKVKMTKFVKHLEIII